MPGFKSFIERPYDIPRRLNGPGIDDKLAFAWLKSCPRLLTQKGAMDDESVEKLIQTAKIAARRFEQKWGVRLGLIEIDTLSRAAGFPAGGENDPSQCQMLMSALTILSTETNCFVLGADHMGKDIGKGTRGGSPKEDYVDTIFYLKGRDRSGEMIVAKVSNDAAGYVVPYSLPIKQLGFDQDHEPITTCTVAWGTETDAPQAKEKKGAAPLEQAINAIGGLPAPADKLRNAFYATYPSPNPKTKRTAWGRAMKGLKLLKNGDLDSPI